MSNPDTVGEIEVDGVSYEVDWPHELDDDTKREDFGVLYRNGEMVAEFCAPQYRAFRDVDDVLECAREFVESDGLA